MSDEKTQTPEAIQSEESIEESAGGNSKNLNPIDVPSLSLVTLEQFCEIAWIKLGLHPDPMTGSIGLDLHQAKMAIDISSAMSQVIEPNLDSDDEKRQLQTMIKNLKFNYISKVKETQA